MFLPGYKIPYKEPTITRTLVNTIKYDCSFRVILLTLHKQYIYTSNFNSQFSVEHVHIDMHSSNSITQIESYFEVNFYL